MSTDEPNFTDNHVNAYAAQLFDRMPALAVTAEVRTAMREAVGHLLAALDADGRLAPRFRTAPPPDPGAERNAALAKILTDLDRCAHGRHAIDPCFSCPDGWSAGNPHLPGPGETVGYDLRGDPYVVPDYHAGRLPESRAAGSTGEPASWRPPTPQPAPTEGTP